MPQQTHLDDAFISYRYAANLAAGKGLVFNPGEYVEGYTNLLWTLLIALAIKLGVPAVTAGHCLEFFSGFLLLVATAWYAVRLLPRDYRYLAVVAPILLYSYNSFVQWTSSGLETSFFALWVAAAFIAHSYKRVHWVLVFCVLATLTRPDGLLVAVVLLGLDWLERLKNDGSIICSTSLWGPVSLYALFIIALTAFRYVYYNDLLPNTFYAKVGGIPLSVSLHYLKSVFADGPGFLLIPFIVGAVYGWNRLYPGVAYMLLTLVYIIYVGGDVFSNGRFILPVLPILCVGAVSGLVSLLKQGLVSAWLLIFFMVTSIAASLYGPAYSHIDSTLISLDKSENRFLPAKRVNALERPGETLAVNLFQVLLKRLEATDKSVNVVATIGIGRLGFYKPEINILDLVGLTDRTIARSVSQLSGQRDGLLLLPGHQRYDVDYVFERRPDLILLFRKGTRTAFTLPVASALWEDERLEQLYEWDNKNEWYIRKDLQVK